jgi:hypothetical protein
VLLRATIDYGVARQRRCTKPSSGVKIVTIRAGATRVAALASLVLP